MVTIEKNSLLHFRGIEIKLPPWAFGSWGGRITSPYGVKHPLRSIFIPL